jgi:hypothetical protein
MGTNVYSHDMRKYSPACDNLSRWVPAPPWGEGRGAAATKWRLRHRGRVFSLFDCMTATSTLLALSSLHEGGRVVRAAGRRGAIPCIVPQACLISRPILATLPVGPGHCSVGKRGARPCLPTPGRPGVMPVPERSRRARREGRIVASRKPARPLLPIDYARRRSYSFCSLVSCIRFIRLEMAACG